ncbi:MAG: hypothetical protein K2M97_01295 [Muribaculaceae bacterium]|nr:hypothetical protein [Muribaculaceae bacterium]
MTHRVIISLAAMGGALIASEGISAQETVTVAEQETVTVVESPCKPRYYNSWRDGWFIQAGAGVEIPFMEGYTTNSIKPSATYNLNVGRWFTPYLALRFSAFYEAPHEHMNGDYTY